MANPEHVPHLDGHDRLTVALYRAGVAGMAAGLLVLGASVGAGVPEAPGRAMVLGAVLLAAVHLHLYDKRIRWAIQGSAGLGAWALGAGTLLGAELLGHAGLGFLFVAVSGVALKERFCFRVPGLRAVPVLLAASLVPLVLHLGPWDGILQGVAALPLIGLFVAKVRQPLHFDVGDRSRYQV